jgi:hypothetical protein
MMLPRVLLGLALLATLPALGQNPLDVARYDVEGNLVYPADLHAWIQTAASVGSDYNEEPIDVENPGTIGVVQMEPTAYDYFQQNQQYADGTMFLLTFYEPRRKTSPQLQGFVQGKMVQQEIHVIDKQRFPETDGHAFFIYRGEAEQRTTAALLAPDNACVACHIPEGAFDGTFVQFYPTLRSTLGLE